MMEKQFLDLYSETKDVLNAHSASIFNSYRPEAESNLIRKGMPTKREEAYLYCPVFEALEKNWGVNIKRLQPAITDDNLFHCAVPGIKTTSIYFTNDTWHGNDFIDLGNGAVACSMKYASAHYGDILKSYYGAILQDETDGFSSLNSLLVQDGIFIYIPQGVKVQLPIQVLNVMYAKQRLMSIGRNLIIMEPESELHYIDCVHTMNETEYFQSRVTEIFVGRSATLRYCSIESSGENMNAIHRIAIRQKKDSDVKVSGFGLLLGATRNHITIDLDEPGASAWLGGMLLIDKKERCDNYTIIRHHACNCTSNELYKYILDDSAEGAFSGRIIVDHGAQKTNSYQTNRNICLSKEARALGRPQLEIYADDVKCGHGATTGMLDENALFYMQQRGIDLKEARLLLLQAFSAEVLENITLPALADRLRLLIEKRLHGESLRCPGCNRC